MSPALQDSSGVARPAWVGLAPRLRMDDGERVLRMDDAAHARLLRQLAARALHEPLLACLAERPDASPTVVAAARALRALLPGHPKPVAALTRAPEVTARLLRALEAPAAECEHETERDAARDALAATVLFALAVTQNLRVSARLVGPLALVHGSTRRGLTLGPGQSLQLGVGGISLDGHTLDPWGPELARDVSTLGRLWTPSTDVHRLPRLELWEAALRLGAPHDPEATVVHELFDAVALPSDPQVSDGVEPGRARAPELTLPPALGCARIPHTEDPLTAAHALLREGVLHRLLALRLVDPLVRDEHALPGLLSRADIWARARLSLPPSSDTPRVADAALTSLGALVVRELEDGHGACPGEPLSGSATTGRAR